ncbi:PKD domain-containing protein [Chitinophaga lutea]
MKQLFSGICVCCAVLLLHSACKKTNTIYVDAPSACFTVQTTDPYSGIVNGTAGYIDSSFYFRNCSDTGSAISYHWDFGDGTASEDQHPVHKYTRRGDFEVSLVVTNKNIARDTVRQMIRVMRGQQYISLGESKGVDALAIDETPAGNFIVLGMATYNGPYYLFHLDSLMQQQQAYPLPTGYALRTMSPTPDGQYIFTGTTTGAANNRELIKMKADGTLLWSRTGAADDQYLHAGATPAGGYGIVAIKKILLPSGGVKYRTLIKRTDGDGSAQWEKVFDDEGLEGSSNALFEQDGMIVPGIRRSVVNTCQNCDSAMIVKVNYDGTVIWRNAIALGQNSYNVSAMNVIKMADGNYALAGESGRGIYIFSSTGAFLDRKLVPGPLRSIANAADGNLIAIQTEYSNGFRMLVNKLRLDGALLWTAYPDGRQRTATGWSCCADSRPVAILSLKKGGAMVLGTRNNSTPNYSYYSVVLMFQLDDTGKLK